MTTDAPHPTYKRVMLKLSGEVFGGGRVGLDPDVVREIAEQIAEAVKEGVEVAVVMGGGNFFRGSELQQHGMDRARADYMGMLGIVMNCLALQDFLEKAGIDTRVQTAITMGQIAEPYIPRRAIRHLEKGRVVIFGAGAGMPFFTTDTVSAQRALEIKCDVVLMSKNGVDGVYSADPRTDPDAVKLDRVTYAEALQKGLRVVDAAAFSLCMDNKLPMIVFGMQGEGNIARAVRGEKIGTLVTADGGVLMIDDTLLEAEEKMEKALEVAQARTSSTIRTGRANAAMFNKLTVEYYGSPTPLQQLASFQTPEARTILVIPFDKSAMGEIERTLRDSNLGINPNNDGQVIRVNLPMLTEERRREYIKLARHKGEDAKISIRNIRRKAKEEFDRLVKDGEVGEDEGTRAEKELEALTKRHVDVVDDLLKHKEAELLDV